LKRTRGGRYNPRLSGGAPIRALRSPAILLLGCVLALVPAAPAAAAAGVPETRTLPNGLRVVLLEDHALPLVAVSLWVGCGSKDEVESSAGYAHFLEHLIQRGTDVSGPFEYTRKAQRWGGALSVRANYDRTAITLSGVPESLDDMVQAAASMALRATLKSSELDLELGSLTQEIRTYYDLPSSVSLFEGMRAAFPGHPYRFPTLGNFRSVGTLKAEPITAFYRNLYVPNNMAIALTGDFEPKAAMARVEAAFGSAAKSATLPARPAAPNAFPGHTDVEKKLDFSESWTSLVFAGPGYRHPDRPAFEALVAALADPSSPLPLAATRDQNGTLAQASFYGLEDAGLLYIALNPATPQLSYAAAASALRAVVAFRATGFTDASARDLTARLLRDERQRAAVATERAERLAEASLFGGVRYYWDRPLVLGRLTASDLNRVAAKYLIPDNCRLVVLVPKETPAFPEDTKAAFHQVFDTLKGPETPAPAGLDANLYPPVEASRVDPTAWGKGGASPLGAPRRTVLKNGLTLLVLEDHRLPSAAVSVHLKGGSGSDEPGKEGRAGLLLRILGTRTAQGLRDRPAAAGAKRPAILPEAQTGRDLIELRFTGDPADVAPGLEAIAKSLKEGVAGADLDRVRQAALQNLSRAEQRADIVGLDLFHEKVYAGHPYAQRPDGTTAGLQAVTAADLQAIAPVILDPGQCVVAVAGDVDAAETARTVERLFGAWKPSGRRPAEARPAATPPAEARPAAAPAPGEKAPEAAALPEAPVFPATSGAQAGEYNRQIATPQSLAIVGVPGVPLQNADFPLLRTLGAAVTLFGFEEMVFTRRAAYGVTGSPEGYRDGGALAFEATAQHTRRGEAVFELQRLMRRLALEDLSDGDRLDLARMQAGRAAAAAQGAQPLASLLAYREASGLKAEDWRADLRTGTPPSAAALRALAERLFQTERSIRVVVGPPSP
jgi:zinc protease